MQFKNNTDKKLSLELWKFGASVPDKNIIVDPKSDFFTRTEEFELIVIDGA